MGGGHAGAPVWPGALLAGWPGLQGGRRAQHPTDPSPLALPPRRQRGAGAHSPHPLGLPSGGGAAGAGRGRGVRAGCEGACPAAHRRTGRARGTARQRACRPAVPYPPSTIHPAGPITFADPLWRPAAGHAALRAGAAARAERRHQPGNVCGCATPRALPAPNTQHAPRRPPHCASHQRPPRCCPPLQCSCSRTGTARWSRPRGWRPQTWASASGSRG